MIKIPAITVLALFWSWTASAADISYSGRLTDGSGKPRSGTVDLEFKFYDDDDVGGTQLGATITANDVTLAQGLFSVVLVVPDADTDTVFGGPETWIQVRDKTNNQIMPRQRFLPVPFALRVPVDGRTISYDDDGRLQMGPDAPGVSSYLKVDAGGNLVWEAGGSGSIGPDQVETSSIQDGAVTDAKIDGVNASKLTGNVDNARFSAYGDLVAESKIGAGAAQLAAGDDARFTDARPPSGAAGGKLSGTYPNPGVNLDATDIPTITSAKLSDFSSAVAALDTNAKTLCPDGQFLSGDATTTCRTPTQIISDGGGLTVEADPQVGANTTNYVSKWDGSALVASGIYDNGTSVGIGTTSPGERLEVAGNAKLTGSYPWLSATPTAWAADAFLQFGVTPNFGGVGDYAGVKLPVGKSFVFNNATTTNMTIASTGRVGVGTTSPLTLMHVDGSTGIAATAGTGATAQVRIAGDGNALGTASFDLQQDPTNAYVWQRDNAPLLFATNATERMRLSADGHLGVGTNTPGVRLDVYGTSSVFGDGRRLLRLIDDSATAAGVGAGIDLGGEVNAAGGIYPFANIKGIKELAGDDLYNSSMVLSTTSSGGSMVERMRLDSQGRVGIGTTSPTGTLEVRSTVANANALKFSDGTNYTLLGGYSASGVGYFGGDTGTSLALHSSGAERVRIDSTGRVGVGVTSPTAKLHVGGTSGVDGIRFPDGTLQTTAASATGGAYVLATYEVADGTVGGACPTGAWNVRPLNTLKVDTVGSVSVSSNQLTLPAGTYRCSIVASTSNTLSTQIRLYNVTDSTVIAHGRSVRSDYWADADADLRTQFTLGAAKVLRVETQCERNYDTKDMGTPTSFAGSPETYMYVECWK